MTVGAIVGDAEAAFLMSREIVGTEIELFSSNTEMIVSQSGSNIHIRHYTFSGPIGAVQQGDHFTATVTQSIDTAGLKALWRWLESLLEKFRDDERMAPLIEESREGAAKPGPRGVSPKSDDRGQGVFGSRRRDRKRFVAVRNVP